MKWVPEWAKFYSFHDCGGSVEIDFYCDQDDRPHEAKPISELAKDLAINDVCQQIRDRNEPKRSKYHREIKPGVWVDVYEACGAFMSEIKDPLFPRIRTAVDHAAKKIFALGERGHKELRTDLVEARDSLNRAIDQLDEWA